MKGKGIRKNYKGNFIVSKVFLGCFKEISRFIPRKILGYFKEVARKIEWCFNGVLKGYQGC